MAKKSQAKSPSKSGKTLQKQIEQYYADIEGFKKQDVLFERGTQHAFHTLLHEEGKRHGWTLIAELEKKVNGKTIRPDGTFKDDMNLVRGYWEAKDSSDKLEVEIEKKRKLGYSFANIIFEDNTTAVLFQNDLRIMAVPMNDADQLADLLKTFFSYIEPEIAAFEEAISEFKERVPDLAEGLAKKIASAHKSNVAFKEAFAEFFELCQTSLNPNISQAAVDEMLIQHILTERLIREIFDNPEFVRRNVIAAEVEKVMLAMTSQSFDRNTYLKELDRFYIAIEMAARTMTDFSDKQHFLNTVYERFFQGYSVKLADTMGIVYTPQEIVDFMCASVAEVLEKEFGKKLWSDDVYIIDPCTGTGNFIVNLIRRIPKAKLEAVYKHRLFANEIMLLPYYIAALNIEHAFYEQAGKYESFEGLCFVDTLDLAESKQQSMSFMTQKNAERVERQKRTPINVVIGNPPYNAHQADENDNNKNRKYAIIDARVSATYTKSSTASNKAALSDPYVKFFRWAVDRLEGRDGIVCFVSNNSFVDQIAFDGMRAHFANDFSSIYHLDLEGNVRHNPTLSGTAYNVFGIQVGVGITIGVRIAKSKKSQIFYKVIDKKLRREDKLTWVAERAVRSAIDWNLINPDAKHTWLVPENSEAFNRYLPIGERTSDSAKGSAGRTIFLSCSSGVKTNRDEVAYDFQLLTLKSRVCDFIDDYNSEVDRFKRTGGVKSVDDFVRYDKIKWSRDLKLDLQRGRYIEFNESKFRNCLYRPFSNRTLFFDRILNEEVYGFERIAPSQKADNENYLIALTNLGSEKPFMSIVAQGMADVHVVGAGAASQCFPFYTYDEDGTNRRENITDWALQQFRDHYKDKKIDKWAIFYYVYGVLHHPGYREKFADNLKRELPRIPFAPDFRGFSKAGEKLAKLHLDYEKLEPWELYFEENPDEPLSYRVDDKMRLDKTKERLRVNKSLTLVGIPLECYAYRLGNRSALDWVIDQYQVHTDKRSGITSDPNREDDQEYIVRLVGQVIRVSMETINIVNALPEYE